MSGVCLYIVYLVHQRACCMPHPTPFTASHRCKRVLDFTPQLVSSKVLQLQLALDKKKEEEANAIAQGNALRKKSAQAAADLKRLREKVSTLKRGRTCAARSYYEELLPNGMRSGLGLTYDLFSWKAF